MSEILSIDYSSLKTQIPEKFKPVIRSREIIQDPEFKTPSCKKFDTDPPELISIIDDINWEIIINSLEKDPYKIEPARKNPTKANELDFIDINAEGFEKYFKRMTIIPKKTDKPHTISYPSRFHYRFIGYLNYRNIKWMTGVHSDTVHCMSELGSNDVFNTISVYADPEDIKNMWYELINCTLPKCYWNKSGF